MAAIYQMTDRYEILLVADRRFPGGTTRALAAEAQALADAGIAAAFCPVLGPVIIRAPPIHPALRQSIEGGTLRVIDPRHPGRVRLAIIHHPSIFTHLPQEPWGLRAERVILVLHHPPVDGLGDAAYELGRIVANLAETFGAPVTLAPVGPAVRRQIAGNVLGEDWSNLLDFRSWRRCGPRRADGGIVIGRHSRPQGSKFPDSRADALLTYPDRPGIRVRMLGFPPELAERYAPVPANWELLPYGAEEPKRFLEGLDYFVYQHGHAWVEAFGLSVLEALAMEVPAILPPQLEPQFGPAAIYAEPSGVLAAIGRFEADPAARARHVAAARAFAETRFSIDAYLPRLDRVLPGWRTRHVAPPVRPPGIRAVMMTSNGVGLGHLSRMLAVARRLPKGSHVAFSTLSQGFGLATEAGYLTQYVPFHVSTGASQEPWNRALGEEFGDFLDLTAPDVVVFDGNTSYVGLIAALDARPAIKRVWMRRALWSPTGEAPQREDAFDLVIEPGELAARFDEGPTADRGALAVAPILQVPPDAQFSRADARAEFGLTEGPIHVGLMIGAGSNFDFSSIRAEVIGRLGRRPGVEITEIARPTSAGSNPNREPLRRANVYPAARLFAAFDMMVMSAGYNSFHEAIAARVPTIFVPNEAIGMDLQILRARFARSIGCGALLRAFDRIAVDRVLDRMFDPEIRADMRDRMARFVFADGAAEAPGAIAALARMRRLSRGFGARQVTGAADPPEDDPAASRPD